MTFHNLLKGGLNVSWGQQQKRHTANKVLEGCPRGPVSVSHLHKPEEGSSPGGKGGHPRQTGRCVNSALNIVTPLCMVL